MAGSIFFPYCISLPPGRVEAEAVLALGPVIGRKVYGREMPIRTVSAEILSQIHTGDTVTFEEDSIIVE